MKSASSQWYHDMPIYDWCVTVFFFAHWSLRWYSVRLMSRWVSLIAGLQYGMEQWMYMLQLTCVTDTAHIQVKLCRVSLAMLSYHRGFMIKNQWHSITIVLQSQNLAFHVPLSNCCAGLSPQKKRSWSWISRPLLATVGLESSWRHSSRSPTNASWSVGEVPLGAIM